jgi:hypothetical protein
MQQSRKMNIMQKFMLHLYNSRNGVIVYSLQVMERRQVVQVVLLVLKAKQKLLPVTQEICPRLVTMILISMTLQEGILLLLVMDDLLLLLFVHQYLLYRWKTGENPIVHS